MTTWLGDDYPDVAGAVAERIDRYRAARRRRLDDRGRRPRGRPLRRRRRPGRDRLGGGARRDRAGRRAPPGSRRSSERSSPSDAVTHGKPHPESYLRALELLGVPAAEAVAFEDTESGVASATGGRDALHRRPRHARARAAREGGRADRARSTSGVVRASSPRREPTARDRPPRRLGGAAREHAAGIRAGDRARRRLRRVRRPRPRRTGSSSSRTTAPRAATAAADARRGARPLPGADRRDGRAEDAVPLPAARLVERTLALLDDDAVVVCFEPGAIGPGSRAAARAADGAARRVRPDPARGGARLLGGRASTDRRATPRALRSAAAARASRRPSTRSTSRRGCSSSRRSASPASSQTVLDRRWRVWARPPAG